MTEYFSRYSGAHHLWYNARMSDNESEKIEKTPWQKIVWRILLVMIVYSLITGGGCNVLFVYEEKWRRSQSEIFEDVDCFIRAKHGGTIRTEIPFLLAVFRGVYPSDIRINIRNNSNEDFTLKINRMTVDDSVSTHTHLIEQEFNISQNASSKHTYIDVPNAVIKNKPMLIRVHGIVERENFHETQEFVIERKMKYTEACGYIRDGGISSTVICLHLWEVPDRTKFLCIATRQSLFIFKSRHCVALPPKNLQGGFCFIATAAPSVP